MSARHWFQITGDTSLRVGADATASGPGPDPDPPPSGSPYAAQRLARLDPGALEGTVAYSFPIPMVLSDPILATTANGGQSLDNGRDIRLEISSVPLAYERTSYDAVNGVLTGWLRLPSGVGAAGLEFDLFVGDADGDDQHDPVLTWAGYYLALASDGTDRAPDGRDFTMGSGMVADTDRVDAFVLPGTATATLANVSWRDGLAGIYLFRNIKGTGMTGTDIGVTDAGDVSTTVNPRTAVMRHRTSGYAGSGSVDTLFAGETMTGGFAYVQGPPNRQITDWETVALNVTADAVPQLFIGGRIVEASSAGSAAGVTSAVGPYSIGRGTVSLTPWTGSIGTFHERSFAYGANEVALLERLLNFDWNPLQIADSGGNFAASPTPPDIDVVPDPPEPPTGGTGTTLPTAVRTVNVANQTEFNAAYADATAGDHIVLANGAYTTPNSGSWAKSGTEANPIVIRASTLLGASLSSTNINASDVTFYGIDFIGVSCNIANSILTNRVKLWRCRWRDRSGPTTQIAVRLYNAKFTDIAYCEFTNWAGRGISTGVAAGARDFTIRRCLFRNQPNAPINGSEAMQLGFTWTDRIECRGLVEENRLEDWNNDDEALSVKTNGITVRRNTLENCRGSLQNRLGFNNRIEANWIKNGGGYINHDGPNLYLGNLHEGTTGDWQAMSIFMGDIEAQTSPLPSNGYNRSSGCVVSGNVIGGTTFIGRNYSSGFLSLAALNTRVRQHTGTVSLLAGQSSTDSQPGVTETLYTWVSRTFLTEADVGPSADL